MKIITRQEAIKLGMKLYFTGKPCKHGHVAHRRVSCFHCVECQSRTAMAQHHKDYEGTLKRNREYYHKRRAESLKQKSPD